MGGLGSPAALYLAAAGVGTLLLADDDALHITNLQGQILYRTADIGRSKAELAQRELAALNPGGRYLPLTPRRAGDWLDEQVARADLVLDCSDNMATRHAINAACVRRGIPLISARAVGFDSQLLDSASAVARGLLCLPVSRERGGAAQLPHRRCAGSCGRHDGYTAGARGN